MHCHDFHFHVKMKILCAEIVLSFFYFCPENFHLMAEEFLNPRINDRSGDLLSV